AISAHCKGALKQGVLTEGGLQEMTVINERDVIRLVTKSKLPQAEAFESWLFDEVIPQVLQTGSYGVETKHTREEELVLSMYKVGGLECVEIAHELATINQTKGQISICDDGVVTNEQVFNKIKQLYPEITQTHDKYSSTDWSKFLKSIGYLVTIQFPRKDGKGLEVKLTYQPTDLFYNDFVFNGMATTRTIDERGKVEVKYTREIEKYLLSDSFKRKFMNYMRVYYIEQNTSEVE
ncbi:MAG: BRO-N domain-containing protein, partial [Bacteroidales bacterium]